MNAPSPRSAQKLFLYNFLVNFSGSTVWKGLLFGPEFSRVETPVFITDACVVCSKEQCM